jgi:hypothetical protein
MTQPIWAGSIPDSASASFAAFTDIISTVSSSLAQRRSLIPDRVWIHSSLESICSRISAFGTTRRGRYDPMPSTPAYVAPVEAVIVVMGPPGLD